MLKKVYVGNLPLNATEKEIREIFMSFGRVHSVQIITDRETGRPRGYCFVEMEQESAKKAANALNGTFFGQRHLFVKPAKEKLLEIGSALQKLTW
jgi:RNA recognition motif-containing protein